MTRSPLELLHILRYPKDNELDCILRDALNTHGLQRATIASKAGIYAHAGATSDGKSPAECDAIELDAVKAAIATFKVES